MSKHVKALRRWVEDGLPEDEADKVALAAADHLERVEKQLVIARKALRTIEADKKAGLPLGSMAYWALAKMKAVKKAASV